MLPEDMQDTPDDATRSLVASAAVRCPAVVARDASYAATGYRSFEFASFEAFVGEVVALVSTDVAAARDLALACAGLVRPTSGSLVVDGVELARRPRRLHRASLPRGLAGVGVFSGLFDIDAALTVEQVVRRELELRCDRGTDALEYLSQFGLATHAGRYVSDLEPAARVRLSCALACAGGVRVAVLNADDRFCDGASVADVRAALKLLRQVCAKRGACALVATGEPALADACDGVCPLDIGAAERLGVQGESEAGAARDRVAAEPERGRVA